MATWYLPQNLTIQWKALILRRDPDFERKKHDEVEYRFGNNREFRADPAKRGPYEDS